jgi:hypothetical protein
MDVVHGSIKEGSLVLAGANPGAFIDNVNIQHGDNVETLDTEAVIYSGELMHTSTTVQPAKKMNVIKGPMPAAPANNDGPSVADILGTLSETQRDTVYALLGAAMKQGSVDPKDPNTITHDKKGDTPVGRNVFDQSGEGNQPAGYTLTHDDTKSIFASAVKSGSLKQAAEEFALAHGINDIETLFPYDQAVQDTPEWISRRMEWVAGVLGSVGRSPFARIRSMTADITSEEARAKGYIKASMKKEQFFKVARRITTPQTVYKKQKLDRDDIVDITDFDVVAWLQTEMRQFGDKDLFDNGAHYTGDVDLVIYVGTGRKVIGKAYVRNGQVTAEVTDPEISALIGEHVWAGMSFGNGQMEAFTKKV